MRVGRAFAPTWRDIPAADAPYLNLTAPAQPNVLLEMAEPTRVPVMAGIHRTVEHLGLRLDDPAAFLATACDVSTRWGSALRPVPWSPLGSGARLRSAARIPTLPA